MWTPRPSSTPPEPVTSPPNEGCARGPCERVPVTSDKDMERGGSVIATPQPFLNHIGSAATGGPAPSSGSAVSVATGQLSAGGHGAEDSRVFLYAWI